ncbi:MAG: fucose isomerase [Halanaerobiales bacterium]|nr:fucose isomerase [Halanaerobiales bacterium]
MKIGMYSLFSPIHDEDSISQTLEQFVKDLSKEINIEEIDKEVLNSDKKKEYDLITIFVKTGGTENLFKDIFDNLEGPTILIATSLHNSLAASMEILSWIQSQGRDGRILHGKPVEISNKLKNIVTVNKTIDKISNSKLGVIGEPSDWLIDSHINKKSVKEKWGIDVVDIPMQDVINEYNEIKDEQAEKLTDEFSREAVSIKEPTKKDLIKASKVYYALKEIVKKYEINALTIRCFDLVTELGTTGCLALSLLNNEGIVAGCEGDVPATVSMMVINYLTDKIPFMANPVSLNTNKNKVKFAHCTIATNSVNDYIIRSHFETGIGVGIQGELNKGDITLFKLGGPGLNHVVYKDAKLINNLNSEFACRTQILVDFKKDDINYFLTEPIGNHHIIVEGAYQDLIKEFLDRVDFETIKHW